MKHLILAPILATTVIACGGGGGDTSAMGGTSTQGPSNGTDTPNLCSIAGGISEILGDNNSDPVDVIDAVHRNGQTFIVWPEIEGAEYHVYRHTSPITSTNLSSATQLTGRWGPLDQDTSANPYGSENAPVNFVIEDGAMPLSDETGLFVHTTQPNREGRAYYAVTSVIGGSEDQSIAEGINATTQPLTEMVATPKPVLTLSTNRGRGRMYTQYMDYSQWNPTLSGYAYNFSVAVPADCDPTIAYPIRLELHAYGGAGKYVPQTEYDWPVIQLLPSDPGANVGTSHSWWYGFAADHNYKTQGSEPNSGSIENFTEQRVLAAIDFLIDDNEYNVDPELTHVFGNSMGASGALALGMRYPSVFAGIYASQPMTDYSADPVFQDSFVRLWGPQSLNLPIINKGPNNSAIASYDSTGVWNWMNHQDQLVDRRGDRFAYLMVDHGKADTTIDWFTQGKPMARVLTAARAGFSARANGGAGHGWQSFGAVVTNVFGFGYGDIGNGDKRGWLYPVSWSFPGISNATGSGSLQPAPSGDDVHNTNIEWSTPNNDFHLDIVDQADRYEISFQSTTVDQFADITPRNTTLFKPVSGTQCSWSAIGIDTNTEISSGVATVDSDNLLTVTTVPILSASGTRIRITCP